MADESKQTSFELRVRRFHVSEVAEIAPSITLMVLPDRGGFDKDALWDAVHQLVESCDGQLEKISEDLKPGVRPMTNEEIIVYRQQEQQKEILDGED